MKKVNIFRNILYSKTFFICLLLFPMLSHLAFFWLGSTIESVALAFKDVNGNFSFNNFTYVFQMLSSGNMDGNVFAESFKNTMLFFTVGICQIPLNLFFAYMIYKKMFGAKFVRTALYLPAMVSVLMMAIMYQQLLMSEGPLLSVLNGKWGWDIPTPIIMEYPLVEIIVFDIWVGVGGNLIIWLGAMGRIPEELLESAKLDGITPFKEFIFLVLPLIWPTFTTYITMQLIGILSASGSVLYFTEGNYGTFTFSYYLYHIIYKGVSSQEGIGSALGLMMTFATLPLVIFGRMFMNKFGEEVQY